MREKKVVYKDEIYTVIYDYGNGRMEIRKDGTKYYSNVELVKKAEVRFLTKAAN